MTKIVVLNDGETYTDVSGCKILVLTEEGDAILNDGGDPRDLEPEHIVESITLE